MKTLEEKQDQEQEVDSLVKEREDLEEVIVNEKKKKKEV